MSDVTRLLDAIQRGDASARDELLPLVYSELRQMARAKMAREQSGQTLQATALIHEAWLRLGDDARFESRAHFFGAAAEAMRRILIESARRKQAARHGGGQVRVVDMEEIEIAAPAAKEDELLAVHDALDQLAVVDAEKAELVKLRFFAGLTLEEAGAVMGISERTAKRHWAYAKAWLYDLIRGG